MELKDFKEYVNKTNEVKKDISISANIETLVRLLIQKGIFTVEEYSKAYEICEENVIKKVFENLTNEQKEQIKTMEWFNNLFNKE